MPKVERTALNLTTVIPHCTIFWGWIWKTWNHSCFQSPRTSPKLAPLTTGHPTGLPDPAWPGVCHHCMLNDHPNLERCGSTAPHPQALIPKSLTKEAWSIFPAGRLRFPNILWWSIWSVDADSSSLSWRYQYTAVCDHSQVRKARRGKCSQWPDSPSTHRRRCQPNSFQPHTGGLQLLTNEIKPLAHPLLMLYL